MKKNLLLSVMLCVTTFVCAQNTEDISQTEITGTQKMYVKSEIKFSDNLEMPNVHKIGRILDKSSVLRLEIPVRGGKEKIEYSLQCSVNVKLQLIRMDTKITTDEKGREIKTDVERLITEIIGQTDYQEIPWMNNTLDFKYILRIENMSKTDKQPINIFFKKVKVKQK